MVSRTGWSLPFSSCASTPQSVGGVQQREQFVNGQASGHGGLGLGTSRWMGDTDSRGLIVEPGLPAGKGNPSVAGDPLTRNSRGWGGTIWQRGGEELGG